MTIDYAVFTAIMGIFGIGVTAIIQFLKNITKAAGAGAVLLTIVVCVGATAGTLLMANLFSWLALLIYSFVVFGATTGLYDLVQKPETLMR